MCTNSAHDRIVHIYGPVLLVYLFLQLNWLLHSDYEMAECFNLYEGLEDNSLQILVISPQFPGNFEPSIIHLALSIGHLFQVVISVPVY